MLRALPILSLFSLVLIPRPALSCECEASFSTCREVGVSDLVFIGKVESIEPAFLNRWNMANQSSMKSLNDAYGNAQEHPSAAALARLKDTYLAMFPGLAANEKSRLQGAETIHDVASLFYSALDRGMRVRFKVKTLFKHAEDDDDAPKKDDPHAQKDPDVFDVWTSFGDCGYDFQVGETYLVYANNEESGGFFFTGSCTRTRRVSDAGDDLAYLFFYKDQPEKSARLEGFTTSDRSNQFDIDSLHNPETVKAPVAGVIVELQSDHLLRYAESDKNGRFLFDGLPGGNYRVSVFAGGYPLNTQSLAGPRPVQIKAKSCARQMFVLPKPDGK